MQAGDGGYGPVGSGLTGHDAGWLGSVALKALMSRQVDGSLPTQLLSQNSTLLRKAAAAHRRLSPPSFPKAARPVSTPIGYSVVAKGATYATSETQDMRDILAGSQFRIGHSSVGKTVS